MTIPAWKSQLQPASFRGIKFFVGDAETVIGRRNVLHEYPLRDTPFAEDLGKKAREYTINAYLMGDDVLAQSKRLIAAIEDNAASGVLVHPTLGLRNVIPTQCRHIFKRDEGGVESFVLTFIEAGQSKYPSSAPDTQSNSQSVAASSSAAMQASFSELFATAGVSDSVSQRAIDTLIGTPAGVGGAVTAIQSSLTGIISAILNKGAINESNNNVYAAYQAQLATFNANVSTYVATPETLAEMVAGLIAGLASVYPNDPERQIAALIELLNLYGVGLIQIPITTPAVPVATPNRIQQSLNQSQLIYLVEVLALVEIVISVSQIDFASRSDAINLMNKIQNLMESILLSLANEGNDFAYNALNTVRIAMIQDITARAATLKTVAYVNINYPIPALVLAYRQYQDATQEADIIARNNIINPVFVPTNRDIEILVP